MYIILIISEVVISTLSVWLARIYFSIYPTCVEPTVCNSYSIMDIFELPNNLRSYIYSGYLETYTTCTYVPS